MNSINSQTHAQYISHRKVRWKCIDVLRRLLSSMLIVKTLLVLLLLLCVVNRVNCDEIRHNRPPRFIIDDQHSEIVLRLKEGPDTPVGKFWFMIYA